MSPLLWEECKKLGLSGRKCRMDQWHLRKSRRFHWQCYNVVICLIHVLFFCPLLDYMFNMTWLHICIVLEVVWFYLLCNESHHSGKSAGKLGILCFLWILVQNKFPVLSWHGSSFPTFLLVWLFCKWFCYIQPCSLWDGEI